MCIRDGVKTIKFKNPRYLGDPINVVRIFNDKEVDEIVLLDITATPEKRGPHFEMLKNIASEAFIPVSYTHLRAHETVLDLVCRLLLEKKYNNNNNNIIIDILISRNLY